METLESMVISRPDTKTTELQIRTNLGGIAVRLRDGCSIQTIVGELHRLASQLERDAAHRASVKPSGEQSK
jgi:hypothetical protein